MKCFILLFPLLLLVSPMCLADVEVEIEFRLHPDTGGGKTRNQGIEVDGDEAEIFLDGREEDIDRSKVDVDSLVQIIAEEVERFELVEGVKVPPPYIEVKMEFSGEDREIEVSRRYPVGDLPSTLVLLQKHYLHEVWH